MRSDDLRPTENIDDRRGMGGYGPHLAFGGIGGVVLLVAYVLLGGNPADLMSGGGEQPVTPQAAGGGYNGISPTCGPT